ncbi:MAG: SirB2 family protein [Burkholderiaceae bacterium]|nr:SirB2 family protein [Burkholderiaceae bacterium]
MTGALYSVVKSTHITLVIISVTLFALRGAATLMAARWPLQTGVRRASVIIDSCLLLAGLGLWVLLGMNLTGQGWLAVKLLLLPVYVVLGSYALKRARSRAAKALFFVLALATVAWMASIAVHHHPLGWLG